MCKGSMCKDEVVEHEKSQEILEAIKCVRELGLVGVNVADKVRGMVWMLVHQVLHSSLRKYI